MAIEDAAGTAMADFIIGKTVKDRDDVRYVRIPGRDRTYTTAVDTTALTTRFQDWIEDDLLQLQPFDIREIIVNDYTIDEVNQRLVRALLERSGATVSVADDGQEALEMVEAAEARQEPFDLLITDMQMPRMDGVELVRRLRATGSMLYIIALTANALDEHRDEALAAGCDAFATKPIERIEFLSACERAMDAKRVA